MSKWNHVAACVSICPSLPTPAIRLLGDGENDTLISLFRSTSVKRRSPRDRRGSIHDPISTQFLCSLENFQTEELQFSESWHQKQSTGSDREAAWTVMADHAGCSVSEVNKTTTNIFSAADLFCWLCVYHCHLASNRTTNRIHRVLLNYHQVFSHII